MDSRHPRRHRSSFLAVFAAIVLFLGSVVFAASASAKDAPGNPAHPNQGKAASAHTKTATRHHTSSHTARPSGSGVSLAKPNSFQAQADPDGMTNGGVDQPGGTGGVDTTTQDGNNGSGNDADCEDDNRGVGVPGHCKPHTNRGHHHGDQTGDQTGDETGQQTGDVPGTTTDVPGTAPELPVGAGGLVPTLATVLPVFGTQVSAPGGASSVLTRDNAVAGVSTTHTTGSAAAARPTTGILPNTGASAALLGLSIAGLAALVGGGTLLRRSRATA